MVKKRVAVFGLGQVGSCIVHAMYKLNYDIVGIDRTIIQRHEIADRLHEFITFDVMIMDLTNIVEVLTSCDLVISALPYKLNLKVAEFCCKHDVSYCDLGGSVEVSNKIKKLHDKLRPDATIFTDLGLAPGLVNIIAEQLYRRLENDNVTTINMYCGGLHNPSVIEKGNPLKYYSTWSIEGLVNEYEDDCLMIRNGEVHVVPSMININPSYYTAHGQPLESFLTSGGAAHSIADMHDRGVQFLTYETLRYRGHADAWKFLKSRLSNEEMVKLLQDRHPSPSNDSVIIQIEVHSTMSCEKFSQSFQGTEYSAMAELTAYPLCAVANQFDMLGRGYKTYKDIVMSEFNCTFALLYGRDIYGKPIKHHSKTV